MRNIFGREKFIFLLSDHGVTIYECKTKNKKEFILDIEKVPHTQFYEYVLGVEEWERDLDKIIEFKNDMVTTFKLKRSKIYLVVEDDIIEYDKRVLDSWVRTLGASTVKFIYKTLFLSDEGNYISLSTNNRCAIITRVVDKGITEVKKVDIRDLDKVKSIINALKGSDELNVYCSPNNGGDNPLRVGFEVSVDEILTRINNKVDKE